MTNSLCVVDATERLHSMLHKQRTVYFTHYGSCRTGFSPIAEKLRLRNRVSGLVSEVSARDGCCIHSTSRKDADANENTSVGKEMRSFEITTLHRLRMCEWSCRVVDHLCASRRSVAVAFNYVDRFYWSHECQSEFEYKLVCTTSLYVALKLCNRETIRPIVLSVLSQSEILPHHIIEMEAILMQNLDYHLNPPTAFCFVETFHGFLDGLALPPTSMNIKDRVIQKALLLVDLSITDTFLTSILPSTIGFAAILNALEIESVEHGGEPTILSSMFMAQSKSKLDFDTVDTYLKPTREKLWQLYEESARVDTSQTGTKFYTSNCHFYYDDTNDHGRTRNNHHSTEELSPVQVDGNVLIYMG